MNIIHIQQKSQAWLDLRKLFNTASEAPIAAGESKYKTREKLLQEKYSGLVEEVSYHKQTLFDKGHAAEEAARSIAENILETDLYPVTATLEVDGIKLLASLDGATMDEDIIWEHKLYSESLAADVRAGTLEEHYRIQMDQQLLVSGAKKCLFMTSDGTENNMAWCWYESSQERFDAVVNAWHQFNLDLADYVPFEIAEKPQANAIMQLPSLAVQIRGEVTLSNLPDFKNAAEKFIAKINVDLKTDQDFATAEATVKFCDKVEKDLDLAKKAAIAQTASIDDLLRTVDYIQEEFRSKRLMLDRLVKTQKEAIKSGILADARLKFADHIAAIEAEIKPIRLVYQQPDFQGAIKNKRTLASLHDAVNSTLANAKIATDAIAKDVRAKLAWHKENSVGYEFLFADLDRVIYKPTDDFQMLVKNRIDQHKLDEKKKLDDERERIQAEEKKKAEEKVRAEQKTVEVAPVAPVLNTAKPTLVKVPSKPSMVSPALVDLARIDLGFFRKKYAAIPELSAVMSEIDAFLVATAPDVARDVVEA